MSMSKKAQGNKQLTWLILVWLLALVLAGILFFAARSDFFGLTAPVGLQQNTTKTPLPALTPLPPTWTPLAPAPSPSALSSGTPRSADPSMPRIEPTFTPANPFPPSPTFVFTPAAFSEGPVEFGKSTAGRPLVFYRFGTGAVHRMIVAGIHGGYEWNTVHLAEELIAYIEEHPDIIPRNVTLFIIPSLNPDGYERDFGFKGRVNDNGVDLNRNFPVNWASDWDRSSCWHYAPTSSGAAPGSEAETKALMDFVRNHTRVTALISYHSAALGIFPGGEPPDQESVALAEALGSVSSYPYPPVDIGCFYTGTLADWAAADGIAAVDLELHTHYFTDFEENLEILKTFMAWRR